MTTVPSSAAMIEPWLKPAASGHQRQDRRDRGHQDRPHAGATALEQGVVRRHALASQPFDEVEQHDRVGHHDPDQHQEPDQRADADGPSGQVQRREGADRREREREQDDERRDERVEGQDHREVDEQDRDGHRGEQAPERLVLLLRDAREPDVDVRRDLAGGDEAVDLLLDGDADRTRVVVGDVGADRRGGRAVDARDRSLGVGLLDGRDLAQRDLHHGADGQRLERVDGRHLVGVEADDDRGRAVLVGQLHLRRRGPGERAADLLAHLRRRQADEDRLVRVRGDADLRRALRQVRLEVEQILVVGQGREDGVVGLLDGRRIGARDDDVDGVRREAGGLRDRDVVAVGLDRRELVREVDGVGGEVDVGREPHGHPGAVRGPAARTRR